MIPPEFWRLLTTISATMIGLVFVGTFYYLDRGWQTFKFFQTEMESLSVGYAKIIIGYFSTSLLLSLLQQPFLPLVLATIGYVILAISVASFTLEINSQFEQFEMLSRETSFSITRWANWLVWGFVFVVPIIGYFSYLGASTPYYSNLFLDERIVASAVLTSLVIGYVNLIQFLLLPHKFHKWEREEEDRENKEDIRQNKSPSNETWDEERTAHAEKRIENRLNEVGLGITTEFDSYDKYETGERVSADLEEPCIRWSPEVSEVGEASIHILIPDDWQSDADLLDRAAQFAQHVGVHVRKAHPDVTGVDTRIWRIQPEPWAESTEKTVILRLRWSDRDMDALETSELSTDSILDSASEVLIDRCLFPIGFVEGDFDPNERQPDEDEEYRFYQINDSSHAKAKWHTAKVVIQSGKSKEEIKELLPQLVKETREAKVKRNTQLETKWGNQDAQIVQIHVFDESREPPEMISNDMYSHYVCKTEWFSSDLNSNYAPTPMRDPDEEVEKIRISWSSRYLNT